MIYYHHDSVKMIGHDRVMIDRNIPEFCRDPVPPIADHFANVIHTHLIPCHFTEQAMTVPRAQGNEIGAFGRIIVILQSDGTAVMV